MGLFHDFDERMYHAAMYDPYPNLTLRTGLTGWGRYFIRRLHGDVPARQSTRLHRALRHIVKKMKYKIPASEQEKTDVFHFFQELCTLSVYTDTVVKYADDPEVSESGKNEEGKTFSSSTRHGLQDGYAGEGMRLLSEIGYSDDSWKQLL